MINNYKLHDSSLIIQSDLAAQFPIYIYLDEKKETLLYSKDVMELLNHSQVNTPLSISSSAVSFLLQNGVVPLPNTVYEHIFIVGIGDTATVQTINNKIEIKFSHDFPFKNEERDKESDMAEVIDKEYVLNILANATSSMLEKKENTYLFHSAGKDSNMIALAMAEAGYQDKITCITHKSKGERDESEFSKKIAKQLGYKHQIMYEPKKLEAKHIESINHYFENIPLPCTDNVTLAYPLYRTQIDFNDSNIIDGSGNDVYIGHVPSKTEFTKQQFLSKLQQLRPLTKYLNSESKLHNLTRTQSEFAGLAGFSFGDIQKFYAQNKDTFEYWKNSDKERKSWDYLDIRADIWGSLVESDRVIRKSRNLAAISSANLILPWTNHAVASYFSKLPESYLFDRKKLKNKLLIREILKEKIGLDSDKLGKMAYSFDFFSILMMMRKEVEHEILSCQLWNKEEIEKILDRLYKNRHKNFKHKVLIQRIYLISIWYNKNRYIRRY